MIISILAVPIISCYRILGDEPTSKIMKANNAYPEKQSIPKTLLLSVLAGVFLGLFDLGPHDFTLTAFIGAVGAGITFTLLISLYFRTKGPLHGKALLPPLIIAGALAAIAWWFIVRPSWSLWLAIAIGSGLGFVVFLTEGRPLNKSD